MSEGTFSHNAVQLFTSDSEFKSTYFNSFYGEYNYQNNSLGKSICNKSEAHVIFVTSTVAQVSVFKEVLWYSKFQEQYICSQLKSEDSAHSL